MSSEERDSKKERRGEKEKGDRGEKYAPPHRRRSRSASREKSKKKKERGRSRERKKEKRARKGRSSSGSSPSRSRDKRRGRKERDERSRSRDRSRDRSRRKERGDGEERGDKRPVGDILDAVKAGAGQRSPREDRAARPEAPPEPEGKSPAPASSDPAADRAAEKARKRAARWDQKGEGAGGSSAVLSPEATLTPLQKTALVQALVQQQAHVTRPARRLYIGSLPPGGITEEGLQGFMEQAIASRGLRLDKPGAVILSTVLPHGGSQRYSFLELRSAIECTRALSLNGQLVMSESRLVIRRGQDWYRPDRQDYEALPPELDELCIPPGLPPNVDGLTILTAAGVDIKTLQRAGVDTSVFHYTGKQKLNEFPDRHRDMREQAKAASQGLPTENSDAISACAMSAASSVPGITCREDALKSTKTQRTVYVGGLPSPVPPGLTPPAVAEFFGAALKATSLHDTSLPGEPIVGVDIASGGHFAFLECRTIAEALSFSALNGIEFLGRSIRLGRPRGYTSVGEHLKDTLRMYKVLGNTTISPDGAEPPDSHEERADGSTEPQRPLLTDASGGSAPPQRLLSEVAGLTEPAIPPGATEALALNHMVKEGDLEDADIMGDILEDAHAECQKHGQVHVILCPKPGAAASDEALDAMIQRRLFVLFGSVKAAVACQRELHGKVFEEDPIDATYVPAELLQALQALPSFDGPTSAADAPGADAP